MKLEEYLFARRVAERLRSGSVTENEALFIVTGMVVGELVIAPVEIFSWKGDRVRLDPASVWCREPWMRDDPDWHNSTTTGMCWVLDDEWRHEMQESKTTSVDLIEHGSCWMIEAVKNLIDRHYHGYRLGLDQWPREWAAFSHNKLGRLEYERDRKIHQPGRG